MRNIQPTFFFVSLSVYIFLPTPHFFFFADPLVSVLFFPRELFTYFGQSLEDTDHPEMTAFFLPPL